MSVKKSKEAKMLPILILNQHFNWISTSSISFFLNRSCQLPKTRLAHQGNTWIFICNIFLNFLSSLQYCYYQSKRSDSVHDRANTAALIIQANLCTPKVKPKQNKKLILCESIDGISSIVTNRCLMIPALQVYKSCKAIAVMPGA